ncbi:MAG: helix-turn-helix domain-containing protein [Clostridia bacterium]|nr:helix-turn-helix domain-containing protein [Clostridia bacterium]
MKIFGERLKDIRTEKHLKQTDIAKMLNVSGNTIHSWETDKQEPSMAMLLQLSEVLEVSLDYLFGKTDY